MKTYTQANGLISIVAAVLEVGPVLELLLGGKLKDRLSNRKLTIDLFLAETEIDDVEEADVLQGVEELLGQGLFAARLVEFGQIKSHKIRPINCKRRC